MCSKLIFRGANINYINSKGLSAIHLMVEHKINKSIKFLLDKSANPHVMDFNGLDACDKAKKNGLAERYPVFNTCNAFLKTEAKEVIEKQNVKIAIETINN